MLRRKRSSVGPGPRQHQRVVGIAHFDHQSLLGLRRAHLGQCLGPASPIDEGPVLGNFGCQLVDSFASFEKGECFLHKAHISEYKQSGPYFNHLATRKRKLLLHRRELRNLQALSHPA